MAKTKKKTQKRRESPVQRMERHIRGLKKIESARDAVKDARKNFRGSDKGCIAALKRADKALAAAARYCC